MDQAATAAAQVRLMIQILQVNGAVPRRAVLLPDGRLGDRVNYPDHPEAELVSRLCEVVVPACPPRRTAELLELALRDNDPRVWKCVCDDLLTDDLDLDIAATVLRQASNAATLMACVVGARDSKHLLHVCCLLSKVLPRACEETRAEVGRSMACQLRPFMDAIMLHGCSIPRDVLESVLSGLGRIVAEVAIPDARVADAVACALGRKCDDLLRLFLDVSPAFVDHRPHQIVPALLDRAKRAPAHTRYPALAMLSRVVSHRPECVAGLEADLARLACDILGAAGDMDCRECLAAASLVAALKGCNNPLAAALAQSLQTCSAELVRRLTD